VTESRLRVAIGVLALIGLGVAGYLTYVHYADVQPFCVAGGGGCEKVQTSDESELLGIPVAVLGLVGYALIGLSALVPGDLGRLSGALLALTGAGFSIYLTYAELFVIDAICQWCVASAVLMVALAIVCCLRVVRVDAGTTGQAEAIH
jgi:uncharacterized membrane protein